MWLGFWYSDQKFIYYKSELKFQHTRNPVIFFVCCTCTCVDGTLLIIYVINSFSARNLLLKNIWSSGTLFHVRVTWQKRYIDEIYRSARRPTGSCRSWCQAVSYLGPFSCPECTFCAHGRYYIPVVRVRVGIQRTIKEFMSQQRGKRRVRHDNTGAMQSERCRSNFSPRTKRRVLDFPVTLTPIVEVRKPTRPVDMIRRCSHPWKQ